MHIDGPAGTIEAEFTEGSSGANALLCHPHPLYGGSMHDGVLACLDEGLAEAGIGSLRFNFRGVGASAGSHDDGQGEAEDVVFLASWLLDRSQQLLLGGYSFGALVALQAMPDIAYHKAVLVAPPVEMVHVPPQALEPPPAPTEDTLVILGDQDQFVSADKAAEFFAGDSVRIHRIASADHFFADSADDIIRQVADFVRDE